MSLLLTPGGENFSCTTGDATEQYCRVRSGRVGSGGVNRERSVPIQLAQFWFPGLVISNAKIFFR